MNLKYMMIVAGCIGCTAYGMDEQEGGAVSISVSVAMDEHDEETHAVGAEFYNLDAVKMQERRSPITDLCKNFSRTMCVGRTMPGSRFFSDTYATLPQDFERLNQYQEDVVQRIQAAYVHAANIRRMIDTDSNFSNEQEKAIAREEFRNLRAELSAFVKRHSELGGLWTEKLSDMMRLAKTNFEFSTLESEYAPIWEFEKDPEQ